MTEIVVVTASTGTFTGLADALGTLPVAVEEHPLLGFTAPADWNPLDRALDRLDSYGAVAFTSPRAAMATVRRLQARGQHGASFPEVWAGGPATSAALGGALGTVRSPSDTDTARWGAARALARAMLDAGVTSPVLFPCGEVRRDELPAQLRRGDLVVDEVVCYRSVLASEPEARRAASRATVLVVSSPRIAALLAGACPPGARPDLVVAGPTTAASAQEAGWAPAEVASLPSVEAVAAAVRRVLARRPTHD
jgi:uroporphyrinogen-III synthase